MREAKERKLRGSSLAAFNYALDKVILSELGHLRVAHVGPDRIARFVRDLERRGLAPSSIRRYMSPLGPIFKRLYAARGLSMLETATIMGQADPGVTWKHYAKLFDRSDVHARVRAAQASLDG